MVDGGVDLIKCQQRARGKEERRAAKRAQMEARRLAKEAEDKKLQDVRDGTVGTWSREGEGGGGGERGATDRQTRVKRENGKERGQSAKCPKMLDSCIDVDTYFVPYTWREK